MPDYEFSLWAVVQSLENDARLTEALLYPEISACDTSLPRSLSGIRARAKQILEEEAIFEVSQRQIPGEPTVKAVTIEVAPPKRSAAWSQPVRLTLPTVRWQAGENYFVAFVPALRIQAVGQEAAKFEQLVESHVRFALRRIRAGISLSILLDLERRSQAALQRVQFSARIRSPKERAEEEFKEESDKKSVLAEVAADLTHHRFPKAFALEETLPRLADELNAKSRRSVLLVGPSGCGKTTAFYELVKRRAEFMSAPTPFYETSGARLVAGMSGYGMWQERCQRLCEEAARLKAVVYFGNLRELMEVGKSEHQHSGIAAFLRPWMERGELLAVAECSPEQHSLIEREDPHLLRVFSIFKMTEPSPEKARTILFEFALGDSLPGGAMATEEALEAIFALHRRYARYSAMPGRPLRFLKNLARDQAGGRITAGEVVAAFARETGLPKFMLDDAIPFEVEEARAWFEEGVIGQPEAARLIVDLLATIKARLARPDKPLASLLLIGPTGVGKTETAKSLAQYLFGDKGRMIRFDMNEFADPNSVRRLIGGIDGKEGLLTAKVREQPFSVILLDEFEKADPFFYDLLLQILGEGRLTDLTGRSADFCNSVILMTSNLGAESFQKGKMVFNAQSQSSQVAADHFAEEVRRFLRPELYNRIDSIVPFSPLDEASILKIARRELEALKTRDGISFRNLSLQFGESIPRYLAQHGHSPLYGARPLKRLIESGILNPLAQAVNLYSDETPLVAEVTLVKAKIAVRVRARAALKAEQEGGEERQPLLADLVQRAAGLRRKIAGLKSGSAGIELENSGVLLENLKRRLAHSKWQNPADSQKLERLPKIKAAQEKIEELMARAVALEETALLSLYEKTPTVPASIEAALREAGESWSALLKSVLWLKYPAPDHALLAVYSEDPEHLYRLAGALFSDARAHHYQVGLHQVVPSRSQAGALAHEPVVKPEEFLLAAKAGPFGLLLSISGFLAMARYGPEQGLHLFKEGERALKCHVIASPLAPEDFVSPAGARRKNGLNSPQRCRTYDRDRDRIEDEILGSSRWGAESLAEIIRVQIGLRLAKAAEDLCLA